MTLKLNELRIGNWIQFQDEEPQQLTAYTLASLCQNPVALEFYHALKITPERLKDLLKFDEHEGKFFLHLLPYTVKFIQLMDEWCLSLSEKDGVYVYSIHQLQNILFELTQPRHETYF